MRFAITASVNAMESQRCSGRIQPLEVETGCGMHMTIFSSTTRLDQLPAVARGIAKTRVHRTVAIHRLLRELHSACAKLFARRAAIVHGHHERRHRALRN